MYKIVKNMFNFNFFSLNKTFQEKNYLCFRLSKASKCVPLIETQNIGNTRFISMPGHNGKVLLKSVDHFKSH